MGQDVVEAMGVLVEKSVPGRQLPCETSPSHWEKLPHWGKGLPSNNSSRVGNVQATWSALAQKLPIPTWAWDPWCDLAQRALCKERWWQLGGQPDLSSELEVGNAERISREEKSKKMPRQAEAEYSRTTGQAEHQAKRRWVLLLGVFGSVCVCVCEGGWHSKQPSWPLLGFVRPGFPSLLLSLWSLMSQLFLSFLKIQLSAEIPIGSLHSPVHVNQRDQMLNQLEHRRTGRKDWRERRKKIDRNTGPEWKTRVVSRTCSWVEVLPTSLSAKTLALQRPLAKNDQQLLKTKNQKISVYY